MTPKERAADPTTPPEELKKLMGRYEVLVAGNPNASAETLHSCSVSHRPGVAKAVLENPGLSVICLEDPERGMVITAKASATLSYTTMSRLFKKVSRRGAIEWGSLAIGHALRTWNNKGPTWLVELISACLAYGRGDDEAKGKIYKLDHPNVNLHNAIAYLVEWVFIHNGPLVSSLLSVATWCACVKGEEAANAYITTAHDHLVVAREYQWQLKQLQEILERQPK